MIDQVLPSGPLPPQVRRPRSRLRTAGLAALVTLGAACGLCFAVPAAMFFLWLSGTYLLVGADGTVQAFRELARQEQLPDPGPAPAPPVATRDAAGAAAAARHVVASYQQGYLTSDPRWVQSTSTASCATCARVARTLRVAQTRGVRFFQVDLEPTAVTVTSVTPERAVVHLSVTTADAYVRFSATDIQGLGGGVAEDDLVLVWAGDRWLVDDLTGDQWAPNLQR